MELSGGSRVGPYEVVAPIGAGGMGKVYRVRDTRLGREVALKVLSAARLEDDSVVRRFELEARLAGSLNHPNILAVYDVGEHLGAPYLVSELLEGSALRQVLGKGTLGLPRALSVALQTAQGLAAAHAKGIVHRDLKPDNLFVLHDGRVKILDFGIAKLTRIDQSAPTLAGDVPHTLTGAMIGTPAYMSPEQARGQPIDQRSDLFSFGSILYEMLAGRRAFSGHTAFETGYAILNGEPPPLPPEVPRLVQRLVFHCLEKRVELRFQSSRDLIFELEELVANEATPLPGDPRRPSSPRLSAVPEAAPVWTPAVAPAPPPQHRPPTPLSLPAAGFGEGDPTPTPRSRTDPLASPQPGLVTKESPAPPRRLPAVRAGFAGLALGALLAAAAAALLVRGTPPAGRVQQLTFRRGYVASARYLPDGANVVFSAAWNNGPLELYTARIGSPDSRPLGLGPSELLAVSRKGELAVLLRPVISQLTFRNGTLAVVDALGGAPRELAASCSWADFAPDGESLAAVCWSAGLSRLELPLGKPLYKSRGAIRFPRLSPSGDAFVFVESPSTSMERGDLVLLDLAGRRTVLRDGSKQRISSPVWSPAGDEIWFTQAEPGTQRAVWAVTRAGKARKVHADTGDLWLQAFSPDGRLLATQVQLKQQAALVDARGSRDISWFDYSYLADLSADGATALLSEAGSAVAGERTEAVAYLRPVDGAAAVRLGPGTPWALSPDGQQVLISQEAVNSRELTVAPVGTGTSRTIDFAPLQLDGAAFLPGGGFLLSAQLPEKGMQIWRVPAEGGPARPLSPEGVWAGPVSPAGDRVAALGPGGKVTLYPLDGSAPEVLPVSPGGAAALVGWSRQGGLFFTKNRSPDLYRFDAASGVVSLFAHLVPSEPAGLVDVMKVVVAPDERHWAWSYSTASGALYQLQDVR